jgi:DNA-binding CsgD family transcriptional regulator
VLAGWVAALTGQTAEAQRWAAILDAASFDSAPVEGTSFDSARAMLQAVMCAAGPEQMMTAASFALAQEPPWSPWRDTALYLCAEAHLLTGNVDRACVLFAESSSAAVAVANADCLVLSESELALVAMDRGRWTEAAERVEQALAVIDEHRMHDYATGVLTFAAAARLAVHRGDPNEADRQITRAMRARLSCTFALPFLAVGTRLQLAKVHLARGEHSTARHLLREIDDVLLRRPDLGALVDRVSELRGLLTSSRQGQAVGGPLSPAELRLLPYLQTHLTLGEIGERLFISRNTVRTEAASIYRKLGVSSRSDAVVQATRIGLLGGKPTSLTGLLFQGLVEVVAERQRHLRGRRDNAREADDGYDADQHVDDLGGRRARAHRGIGLGSIGGDSTADRHQRGEPDELQRLQIELQGLDLNRLHGAFGEARVVEAERAQSVRVVHADSSLYVVTSEGITARKPLSSATDLGMPSHLSPVSPGIGDGRIMQIGRTVTPPGRLRCQSRRGRQELFIPTGAVNGAGSGDQRNASFSGSDGVLKPRVCRGRPFSSAAMSSRSSWL